MASKVLWTSKLLRAALESTRPLWGSKGTLIQVRVVHNLRTYPQAPDEKLKNWGLTWEYTEEGMAKLSAI